MADKRPKILTDAGYEIYCDVKKIQYFGNSITKILIRKINS
ncbi:MAG: hypothetical protein V1686_00730 [Patescibacteria group bacterium]